MSSEQQNPTPSRRRPLILGAMWVVSLVVAFLLGTQVRPASSTPTAPAASDAAPAASAAPATPDPELQQFLLELPRRQDGDPLAMGSADAKVVLTNWSDYRCPFCALWHEQTLPQLQKYIDDGSVRMEFRDLAIFGAESVDTAVAARAAAEQGKFWEFQEAVFAAAPPSGHPEIDRAKLLDFARTAGVPDMAAFEAALSDEELIAAVQQDTSEAQQLGITGTPFFVVGGQVLSGAQPVEVFESVIKAELAR